MSTDHEGAAGACDQADTHGFGAGALAELLTRVARLEGQSRECRYAGVLARTVLHGTSNAIRTRAVSRRHFVLAWPSLF